MLAFEILLLFTALGAMLTVIAWARVASSRSVSEAFKLDGTEKLAERANRRAFHFALVSTVLTIVLASAAYSMS